MLIFPHTTDLRLGKRPYITYLVIAICLVTYFFQAENSNEINRGLGVYCESIYTASEDALDILAVDEDRCINTLGFLHERKEHGAFELIEEKIRKHNIHKYTTEQIHKVISLLHSHIEQFEKDVPVSIDGMLMHFPNELNPIPMVTSVIAHADWGHVIFNLIFFISFASTIEILIDNKLKYVGFLVALSLVTSLFYALSVLVAGDGPVPSLGLSGVVMGMIGMSAYLMPMVRIKVFVWLIVAYKNFYIPAWILAVYYIGDDIWSMFYSDVEGVNFVSHVSGGIAGYIFGYIWFKDRKKEIQDELADEIKYQQEERKLSKYSGYQPGSRREFAHKQQVKQFKKTEDEYYDKLYRFVRSRRDADAIVLILRDYELQSASPVIFEELFERVKQWGDSITLLCLGRLVINLLLQQRKYARALLFVEQCQGVASEFVLADPGNVLLLARTAQDSQQYQVAYLLVRDANERYGEYIDYGQCVLMELDLLMHYLDKQDEARRLIKEQFDIESNPIKKELMLLMN